MNEPDRIAEILGEWIRRKRRGEAVDPEQVVRDHPDLAEALRARFAAMAIADQVFAAETAAPAAIGEYRIIREIGRGGMGVVYEAEQASLGRRVALKVLPVAIPGTPQAVKRFKREAKAAARLHHTNIVPVYAMGHEASHWYYAMELIPGRPLSAVIAEMRGSGQRPAEGSARASSAPPKPPAPESATTGDRAYFVRVAAMFAGVAEALDLAHTQGIVHRDVKPSNLLLDVEGTLKIVDFGLARLDGEQHSITITGDLLGTPVYMSPEQAMAKRMDIDQRTDIYSLGATLYELLTLSPPFEARSLPELCSQIITKDPELPRHANRRIPRDLETIVLKAMEKDRDKRYQSARAFARDLWAFAQGGAIHARRIGSAARMLRKMQRHRVRSALAAALVAAVGAGAWIGLRAAADHERARTLEYARLCAEGEQAAIAAMSGRPLDAVESVDSECFDDAIALAPDRPEAYVGRALVPGRALAARLSDMDEARARGLSLRTWHLARAHLLEGAGREEEAQLEGERAKELPGDEPLDLYFEARLLVAESRWNEVRQITARLITSERAGPAVRYVALRLRFAARLRAGENALALEDLIRLQELGDKSAALRANIACMWRTMDQKTADRGLDDALAQVAADGSESAWDSVCSAVHAHGYYDWLDRATRLAVEARTASVRLLVWRSDALHHLSRFEEAVAVCDRAIEVDPSSATAHRNRGLALLRLKRYEEALAAYDRALKITRTDGSIPAGRGLALASLGRYEDALAAFDRALEIDPNDAISQNNRGNVLRDLGRCEEAVAAYERAARIRPDYANAHCNRSIALGSLGRYDDALAAANAALEIEPNWPKAHGARGDALSALGRCAEALAAFDRALALDPNSPADHCNRGNMLARLGRYKEALAAYDRAIEIDRASTRKLSRSNLAALFLDRGAALTELGRYEEGLVSCDGALEIDPCSAAAHSNRGRQLGALGRIDESMDAYDDAIRNGLRDPERLNEVAWYRATCVDPIRRNPARAVELAQAALKAAPQEGGYWNTLGVASYRAGDFEGCLRALDRSMDLGGGGDAYDWFFVAQAWHRLGKQDKASEFLSKAVAWMQEHAPDDEELKRFRGEAEQLINGSRAQ